MGRFNLEDYVLVEDRIEEFWTKHPKGRILTEVTHLDHPEAKQRMVVIKATIYTESDSLSVPIATGWAKEREGTMGANQTAFLENAETSAIGRALANMGVATKKGRPSRQEMEAVERNMSEHEAILDTIKELASKGNEELKKKVKSNWKLLKEDRVEAAKFLEAMGAEYPEQE